ncbi:MAG: hypothetical protein ABJC39_02940 [Chloroflexota bacterium]
MIDRTPGALTDALIERMLGERAGASASPDLVSNIIDAAARIPQRRQGILPPFVVPRSPLGQALLIAAVLALLALAVAGVIAGSSFLQRPELAVVPPEPTNGVVTTAAPSPTGGPTPTPRPSATAGAQSDPPGLGLIAVYQARSTAVDIFTIDPVTGEQTLVGNVQRQGGLAGIQWSLDRGRMTLFTVGDGASVQAQVDVAAHSVTPLRGTLTGSGDSVSPTGDRIAGVEGDVETGFNLIVLDLDQNEVTRTPLPEGATIMGAATWAPDGSAILLSGCLPCSSKDPASPTDSHLFIVPMDGGPVRQIGTSTTSFFGAPSWSSDLSTIAYSSFCSGETCSAGINTISLANGRATTLTGDAADAEPVWSRDGRRIAFVRGSGAGRGLWVMDADGGHLTRLTTATKDDSERSPTWSPDGSAILFTRGVRSDTELGDLWIVPSTGGTPVRLIQHAVGDW